MAFFLLSDAAGKQGSAGISVTAADLKKTESKFEMSFADGKTLQCSEDNILLSFKKKSLEFCFFHYVHMARVPPRFDIFSCF